MAYFYTHARLCAMSDPPGCTTSTCSDLYVKHVYDNNSAFASNANAWTGAQKFPLRQGRRNQEQDEQARAHLNDLSVPPTPAPAPTPASEVGARQ